MFKALGEPWGTAARDDASPSSSPRQRFDCQECGACCCNTARNRELGSVDYVEVAKTDELFKRRAEPGAGDLLKRVAVRNDDGVWHLKLVGEEQRCLSLDGDVGVGVGCDIYALRPSGCRRVEAGDEECLRARRLHGLSLALPER